MTTPPIAAQHERRPGIARSGRKQDRKFRERLPHVPSIVPGVVEILLLQ
jgi:hypothetical protein